MSRNEDLEFFCDGLTESLITNLSRGLRITLPARNSSLAFKGQAINIRVAAKKLGVRYLIESSVQAMGARAHQCAAYRFSKWRPHLGGPV
ncbi:MAG: hypothetical protein VCE75_09405 [Alphaproteobacteria bacterium]